MKSKVFSLVVSDDFVTNKKTTMFFNETMEKVFLTNTNGLEILKLIDGRRTVECIVKELSKRYSEIPESELFQDVCDFIQLLYEKGICIIVQDVQ